MTLGELIEKLKVTCVKTPDKPVHIKINSMLQGFLNVGNFQISTIQTIKGKVPVLTAQSPIVYPGTTVNCLQIAIENEMSKNGLALFGAPVILQHNYDNAGNQITTPKELQAKDACNEPFCFFIYA